MGSSNSHCIYNDCYYDCCDIYGYCPNYSYQCEYYYSSGITTGAIVGIVFACLVICFIIILTIYCIRRCQRRHAQSRDLHQEPFPPPHNQGFHQNEFVQRNQYQANPYDPYSNLLSPQKSSGQPVGLPPSGPSIDQQHNIPSHYNGNPYSVMSLPIASQRNLNNPNPSNPDIYYQMNRPVPSINNPSNI